MIGAALLLLGLSPAALPGKDASAGAASGISWEEFQDPGVEYRPWVRWWWPGNDVEDGELRREIKLLYDNGFGGVEIQCFVMGLDPKADREEMARRVSFDTPSFYAHVATVMDEAKKYGMGVDLNLGSGWPSGGAHVTPAMGMKTLLWSEQKVTGPRRMHGKLRRPEKPGFYTIAKIAEYLLNSEVAQYRGDDARLMAAVAYRVAPGKSPLAPKAVRLDPESAQVITDKVDADGVVTWDAPAGKWLIVGVYLAPDGERPTLSAQADPGFVVDHFDAAAAVANVEHLAGERTGLLPYAGAPFRAFFNDSFEFKTERHITPDFLAEFKKRRGYDLAPRLAALRVPGGDNFFMEAMGVYPAPAYVLSELDARVRYDYDLTVSDLFIERYLDPLQKWAHERGLQSRAQTYGLDIDVIRAMGHVDIPETEQLYAGGSEMFLKMASSGAHLAGKNVVSAESFVWAGRDYMTTPLKIKAAADKLFTSGVNHIIYHGYSYRKTDPGYGETGWFPWSSPFVPMGTFSTNMSEANPYWKYIRDINLYIARCQYLLRQGKPDYDLIVYYPFLGFPSSFSQAQGHDEFLFNGQFDGEPEMEGGGLDALAPLLGGGTATDPRIAWLQNIWPMLQDLENNGYTWEWVNDDSLARAETRNRKIVIGDNEYKALVIANAPWIGVETAERLNQINDQLAIFIIYGAPPAIQPGFKDYSAGDNRVREAFESILKRGNSKTALAPGAAVSSLHETILSGTVELFPPYNMSIRTLSKTFYSGTVQQKQYDVPVTFNYQRRRLAEYSTYLFISNPTGMTQSNIFYCYGCVRNGEWIDPWNGRSYRHYDLSDDGLSGMVSAPFNSISQFTPYELPHFNQAASSPETDIDAPSWCSSPPDSPELAERLEWICRKSWRLVEEKNLDHWFLTVEDSGNAAKAISLPMVALNDWREIKELRYRSNAVTYKTEFDLKEFGENELVELDLGTVHGVAEVRINGQSSGVPLAPPFRLEVSGLITAGRNVIEVTVIPPLRNSFIGKARGGDKRYKQFKGKEATLLPAGLLGPTKLMMGVSENRQ
ncbi:MAG TPA: glycosyl hydrolase [bacterium]|nr:glycosyl hydrolase [bacterium]